MGPTWLATARQNGRRCACLVAIILSGKLEGGVTLETWHLSVSIRLAPSRGGME